MTVSSTHCNFCACSFPQQRIVLIKIKEKKRETSNEIDGENITLLTEKSFVGNLMTFNQVGAICIKQLFHKIECYTELGMNSYRDVFFSNISKTANERD